MNENCIKGKNCWQPFFFTSRAPSPLQPPLFLGLDGYWKGARGIGIFYAHADDEHMMLSPTHLGTDDDAVAYFSCLVGWTGRTRTTPLAPSCPSALWINHKSMKHIFIAHKCHHGMRYFRSPFCLIVGFFFFRLHIFFIRAALPLNTFFAIESVADLIKYLQYFIEIDGQ